MSNWTWYPSGGDWTYIESICKLYEMNGHNIIPFSVHDIRNFPTPYEKYFLDKVDYKAFYNKIPLKIGLQAAINSIYSIEAKKKLKLLLSENKIDIAQLNNITGYQTPSIIPVLKKSNIPIVWRILDYRLICPNSTLLSDDKICEDCFKHKYYNCILKKCKKKSFLASTLLAIENYVYFLLPIYNDVDIFLFQSEFTRDMFVKFGYDVKRTLIIKNPYDFSNVKPIYNSKKYILYFGRLSKEKGILTLLKAMKNIPDIELKVVGSGPDLSNYLNYIDTNKIKNVNFLGPKWNKELEPIIKDCEFVVVPSEWNEPSGYVVLQSFSYGKPVLVSNIGGLKDIVTDNYNGLLFEPGNAVDLSQKIIILHSNKDLIRKLGANGRNSLEEDHNPKHYYQESITIFNKLINSK